MRKIPTILSLAVMSCLMLTQGQIMSRLRNLHQLFPMRKMLRYCLILLMWTNKEAYITLMRQRSGNYIYRL